MTASEFTEACEKTIAQLHRGIITRPECELKLVTLVYEFMHPETEEV